MVRKRVMVIGVIACLLLAGAAVAATILFGPRAASSEAAVTPSAAVASPATAITTPPAEPPKEEELDSLGAAFESGSTGSLRPFLAVEADEQLDSSFTEGVKELGLVLDEASVSETAPGIWTVRATGRKEKEWEIGLIRDGEQLKVIYAEAPQ